MHNPRTLIDVAVHLLFYIPYLSSLTLSAAVALAHTEARSAGEGMKRGHDHLAGDSAADNLRTVSD